MPEKPEVQEASEEVKPESEGREKESFLDSAFDEWRGVLQDTAEREEAEENPEVEEPEGESESDADEQSEPEAEPEKPDPSAEMQARWDKELQQVQQLRATLERQVAAYQSNPTPKQAEKVEKTKSRLDEILESSDIDLDPGKGLKAVASEMKGSSEKTEAELAKLRAENKALAEAVQEFREFKARQDFIKSNPDLGEEGYDKLREAVANDPDVIAAARDEDVSNAAFNRVVRMAERSAIAELKASYEGSIQQKAKAQTEKKPEPEKIKQPSNSNPVKKSNKSTKAPSGGLPEMGSSDFYDSAFRAFSKEFSG